MTRAFAVVLIAINILDIAGASACLYLIHPRNRAITADELERSVSARLNSVSTPAEMQSARTDVARIMASVNRTVHGSVTLADKLIRFLLITGVLNVVFILVGMWTNMFATKSV